MKCLILLIGIWLFTFVADGSKMLTWFHKQDTDKAQRIICISLALIISLTWSIIWLLVFFVLK